MPSRTSTSSPHAIDSKPRRGRSITMPGQQYSGSIPQQSNPMTFTSRNGKQRLDGIPPTCYLVGMERRSAKDSKMIAQERRQRIIEDIETSGIAAVRDLAQRFEVSHITIMRDLQELEQEGLIRRVHGGSVSGCGPRH